MKISGFIILTIVLVASLFKWGGAELDRGILTLSAMILLITMYSDLKEFNFWGLWGKKDEKTKELSRLEGKQGMTSDIPNPDPQKVQEVQQEVQNETPLQLMDNTKGNFLALAFEIERILRIASGVILGEQSIKKGMLANSRKLKEVGFFTENGFKQIEGIRWLRNMLVHGRSNEIADESLTVGTQLALNLYNELNNWLQSANINNKN